MRGREEKYKRLYSKSHEKILKVILQKYKPILQRKPKNPDPEEPPLSSSESDSSVQIKHQDYSNNPIKIDNASLERRKREETVAQLMGREYPHLGQMYISGELTLAQLKQHFYSISKKIDYTCYDELKKSLNLPERPQSRNSRPCYSAQRSFRAVARTRPHSANWNFDVKVRKSDENSRITSEIFNADAEKPPAEPRSWNSSIKVNPNLISDPYRQVCITNDRRERPKSSTKHGGRLSAKAMHDLMVESIFPFKNKPETKAANIVAPAVKEAVHKAADRIKNYSEFSHRRAKSVLLKKVVRERRTNSEVRDVIYL